MVRNLAVPPGETLLEELEARALSQRALALRIGRPGQVANAICKGTKAITAETAPTLELVFNGLSAEFWLHLQSDYDLAVAQLRARSA